MPKPFATLVVAANIAAILALACGGAAAPTATRAPAAPAATAAATATRTAAPAASTVVAMAKPSGTLILADSGISGRGLDPGAWIGEYRGLYRVIYEGLMGMNTAGTNYLSPVLATGWEMSQDGLSWTFHIRKGVKFHNGEDFTAQVMAKNMQRSKGLQAAFFLANTTGYEFPDSHTLVLKLKGPDLGLLSRLVYGSRIGYPAPAGYIDTVGEEGIQKNPVGTGPYKFVKSDFNTSMELEAWEGWGAYWDPPATVKTVLLLGIPEEITRIAMLATGEADIAFLSPGPQLKELKGGATVHVAPSVRTFWLEFFNQADSTSPYSNVKVRQAMNYAVDKQTIVDRLLGGAGDPAASTISPFQLGYPKDLKPYPYDPEKAKRLLAEAGYPDGFDGGSVFATTVKERTEGQAIADYLGKVGIRVSITPMDSATYGERFRKPKHNLDLEKGMGFLGSSLAGDGDYRIESFFTKYGFYSYTVDPAVDALYDKTLTILDPAERERYLQQLATYTYENGYKLFLWYNKSVWGWGPRVADWKHTPGEELGPSNFHTLRLK